MHSRTRSSRPRRIHSSSPRARLRATSSLPSSTRSSRRAAQKAASAGVKAARGRLRVRPEGDGVLQRVHQHRRAAALRQVLARHATTRPSARPCAAPTSSAMRSACEACGSRSGGRRRKTSSTSTSLSGRACRRALEPKSSAHSSRAPTRRRTWRTTSRRRRALPRVQARVHRPAAARIVRARRIPHPPHPSSLVRRRGGQVTFPARDAGPGSPCSHRPLAVSLKACDEPALAHADAHAYRRPALLPPPQRGPLAALPAGALPGRAPPARHGGHAADGVRGGAGPRTKRAPAATGRVPVQRPARAAAGRRVPPAVFVGTAPRRPLAFLARNAYDVVVSAYVYYTQEKPEYAGSMREFIRHPAAGAGHVDRVREQLGAHAAHAPRLHAAFLRRAGCAIPRRRWSACWSSWTTRPIPRWCGPRRRAPSELRSARGIRTGQEGNFWDHLQPDEIFDIQERVDRGPVHARRAPAAVHGRGGGSLSARHVAMTGQNGGRCGCGASPRPLVTWDDSRWTPWDSRVRTPVCPAPVQSGSRACCSTRQNSTSTPAVTCCSNRSNRDGG